MSSNIELNGMVKEFKTLIHSVYNKHKKQIDRFSEETWWGALKNYDYKEVKNAFIFHYTQSVFFPFEKDIINIIESNRDKQKTKKDKSLWSDSMQENLDKLIKVDYLDAIMNKDMNRMREIGSKVSSLETIKESCA